MSHEYSLVTIFVGSGFLGRHVVRALASRGWRVRVAVRRPDLAVYLQPLGRVGQIHAVQANLRYPESVEAAASGSALVINLVGILFQRGRQRFDAVQAEGAGVVARAAARAGATMWNDVTALRWSPQSPPTAAALGCEVVLMHMRGEPRTMQAAPSYDDVVEEVTVFLAERAEAAMAAGVARERIWLDPGLGFGKSAAHSLELLRNLDRIVALGFPVLVGASRKSSIARIAGDGSGAEQRLGGSIAAALAAARSGAAGLRVHDVAETRQALAVAVAIGQAGGHERL